MSTRDSILKEVLTLKPSQKAELVDKLLTSLDKPDREIDDLWPRRQRVESMLTNKERSRLLLWKRFSKSISRFKDADSFLRDRPDRTG